MSDSSIKPIVTAVFADGGCIGKNPSSICGTWSWCHVNDADERIAHDAGVILPCREYASITNNFTEFVALVLALEALPKNWAGHVYSDSQVTLGRMFKQWKFTNIPYEWVLRGNKCRSRLGYAVPVLLQGHPTKADLLAGVGAKRGLPVSVHNQFCDAECNRVGKEYIDEWAESVRERMPR